MVRCAATSAFTLPYQVPATGPGVHERSTTLVKGLCHVQQLELSSISHIAHVEVASHRAWHAVSVRPPQSLQSVFTSHSENWEPGPPSSHMPSLAKAQVSLLPAEHLRLPLFADPPVDRCQGSCILQYVRSGHCGHALQREKKVGMRGEGGIDGARYGLEPQSVQSVPNAHRAAEVPYATLSSQMPLLAYSQVFSQTPGEGGGGSGDGGGSGGGGGGCEGGGGEGGGGDGGGEGISAISMY